MGLVKVRLFGLLCICFFLASLAGNAANCPLTSACYGPGLGSDGLANTVIGGPDANIVSYRFRAGHTGSLQQIHIYLMQAHAGYSAGTGGLLQVTVNADDGTPAHNPSSTVLATYLLSNPSAASPSIYFPIFVFSTPPSLVAGQLYHIVFTDVDPNPTANYLSVNTLYYDIPPTPSQPTMSDTDFAELLTEQGVAWAPRQGYTPILELDYQDGFIEGNGYMESWVGAPQTISGPAAVRETITVSSSPVSVAGGSVRIARISGSDPLIVRLENGDGTLIEQVELPADAVPLTSPATFAWANFAFSSAHTLATGQNYHLQFGTAASSSYQTFPIRKGYGYGFQAPTYFQDGFAQFNSGDSWVGWTQWDQTNRLDGDLQYYFVLAPSIPPSPVISDAVAATVTTAAISWTTDEPATSQVQYGVETTYSALSSPDPALVTTHSVTLNGLVSHTLYHYSVISTNAAGEQTVSGDLTFSTP